MMMTQFIHTSLVNICCFHLCISCGSSAVKVAMKGGAWWGQKGGKPAAATSAAAASTEYKVNTKVANVNGTYKLSGNNHNRGIYQMYEGELKDAEMKEMPVLPDRDKFGGR